MRLKDVAILNPKYDGENLDTELVSFSPMECLRYDNLRPYTIPFKDAKGKYTYFANNDVLFAKVTPCFENLNTAIASNLLNGIGFGSSEINVLRFSDKCYTRYFFYLICSRQFIDKGCASMSGVGGLKRINPLAVTTFEFELPPRFEQETIADYLDQECDKITREIDLLERKVDCYRRLRRSIINRAVTRGLDPNIPLKPSGSDWIGNIPRQWTIKRNKEFLIERKETIGNNHNLKLLSLTLNGITIRDLDAGGKFPAEFSSYKIVSPNNLVFCLFDVDETPRTVGLSSYAGMITGAYDIFDADTSVVSPKWVYYFYLSVDQKKALKPFYTGLRKVVKSQKFANIHIPIPPIAEQNIIITYLDETCVKIDTIIEKIKLKIGRLKELKRSLINEVVTGQRTIKTSDL